MCKSHQVLIKTASWSRSAAGWPTGAPVLDICAGDERAFINARARPRSDHLKRQVLLFPEGQNCDVVCGAFEGGILVEGGFAVGA